MTDQKHTPVYTIEVHDFSDIPQTDDYKDVFGIDPEPQGKFTAFLFEGNNDHQAIAVKFGETAQDAISQVLTFADR